eukprot:m.13071 g.13071  ORF g.13071 m.13071 type:complete len:272 (+) comp4443_c0_seq1:322-1137(+)
MASLSAGGSGTLPVVSPGRPARPRTPSRLQRYKYIRRLFNFRQMDFEFALNQMFYLIVSPQRVYRDFYYHKRTKNQWARDDPAFLVLLAAWLAVSSVGCAIVFGLSFSKFIGFLLWVVFVDCIGVGAIIATVFWFVTNKYLKTPPLAHSVEQHVEWGYAFDVHCNAFFPLLIVLHVLQVILISFIKGDWFGSVILADTLWLVAINYYIYITFLGYRSLSNILNTKAVETVVYKVPLTLAVLLYIVAVFVLRWNISMTVFRYYGLHNDADTG